MCVKLGKWYVVKHNCVTWGVFNDYTILYYTILYYGDRGSTVVKVLCYKSEGRWFDPSWCHWIDPSWCQWIFHWHKILSTQPLRNDYREYFLGVKSWQPTAVPLSRNLGALTSWNPLGLSRSVMWLLYTKILSEVPLRAPEDGQFMPKHVVVH